MGHRTPPLVVALAVVAVGCNGKPPAQPAAGPPKVTVATPLVQSVTEFTELTGSLAAVKTADVRPRVSGYIQKVMFEEGAEIAEGAPLVQIDPEPFNQAVAQATANLKSAQAQSQLAAATEARQARIRGSGATTEEEYEQARAQASVARANVQGATAALEQARLNLQYTTVRASFAGRIDRIFVNEGNVVTGGTGQGTILTRVVTVDPIYAYFTVDEQTVLDYLRRVGREGRVPTGRGTGPVVEVRLRDETGYPHKGTIDFVSSELNPATGSLQIRGTLPNPGPPRLLRPGFFVRGRIPVTTAPNATLVPDEAVVMDQAQRVVYLLGPGNRVVSRPVTLGPQSNGLRVVEGVLPTDRVIIRGLARLQPDMEVDPIPGEIKPTADTSAAAGSGGWGLPVRQQDRNRPTPAASPMAPDGNPEEGARPGKGGNAVEENGARGRPAGTPPAVSKGM
jgi:RND family efflux transporter MFP subunit